jgi:DNA repair exonuclease SbcCD nuclease subunit
VPRFLHTADLHINALRRFPGYLDRAARTLDEILLVAEYEEVDFIIVAGDVFEHRDIRHGERQTLSRWLAKSTIPIVITSGNHDKRSKEVGDTAISYLSALTQQFSEHLIYDGRPRVVQFYGCQLLLMPYQGWMDAEAYVIVSALLDRASSKKPVVAVLHEAVSGAKTDSGFLPKKRNQIHLNFFTDEVCYWALGDIHQCQKIHPTAWYSGSPHQVNFGERNDKGVLVVDTDIPDSPKFVPIKSTPLVVLKEEPEESWPDGFVQCRAPICTRSIPENVEYLRPQEFVPGDTSFELKHGLFQGLVDSLLKNGLPKEHVPRALHLLKQIGSEIDLSIDVSIPDRRISNRDNVKELLAEEFKELP